jgi:hypothetical protein
MYGWYNFDMNKKISLFIIMLLMIPTVFLAQSKKTHAFAVVESGPNVFTNAVTTSQSIWQVIKDDVGIPIVQALGDRLAKKISSDVINWASGGFDGDPSFVNNWDEFLKGTEHEVLSDSLSIAQGAQDKIKDTWDNRSYSEIDLLDCQVSINNEFIDHQEEIDSGDPLAFYTTQGELDTAWDSELERCEDEFGDQVNPTTIAQQNHELNQSGELESSRTAVETVAKFGADTLNADTFKSIVNGEGDTLTALLGSKAKKEQFKSDITVGGWEGYLALADPHNYDSGLTSLITGALGQKTTSKVNSVVQDIQTPQKLLNITTCSEYEKDSKGQIVKDKNGKQKCARKITGTPGDLVADKLKKSLSSGEDSIGSKTNALVGALLQTVGALTDGLISKGFSELSGAAQGAFISSSSSNTFTNEIGTGGNYQSQYDVLGIQSKSTVSTQQDTVVVGENTITANGNTNFIGGPEDVGAWNNSPQIIINFQEDLEEQIKKALEEQKNHNLQREIFALGKNTVKNIDQCLPGPDYGWEERYQDAYSSITNDDERLMINIALQELKKMINDPQITIPGALAIKDLFQGIIDDELENQIQNELRSNAVSNIISTMNFIKGEVLTSFNIQKLSIDPNLVIFEDDWANLSTSAQENLLGKAIDNTFFLLKADETIDSVIANENDRARDGVINMAWDLWRKETSTQQKTDLRYAYHVIQNDLSNEQFIAQARSKYNRLKNIAFQNEYNLTDCLVLKAYSLGTPESQLKNIITSTNTSSIETVSAENNQLINLISNLPRKEGPDFVSFIDTSNGKSDSQIKNFIESEKVKQSNNQQSLLKTNFITSGVSQSILGFSSESAKEDYFNLYYPDEDFEDEIIKNKLSILEIFRNDRFAQAYRRYSGERGGLFCRIDIMQDLWHGGPLNIQRSLCIRNDWYIASELDYKAIFSGI